MIRIFHFFAALFLFSIFSFAGSNLPQLRAEIKIKGNDHLQLRKYFAPFTEPPDPLEDTISTLLLKHFPKEFKTECKEMIEQWGKSSKGKSSSVVRVVYFKNYSANMQYIFLAYTCFSSAEGFGDKYYDERLALLTVENDSSKLLMLPNNKPCDKCSDLTRIGLEEDDISIGNSPAVCVVFGSSNMNPCCETTGKTNEITLKYYILEQKGVREVLTVLKERNEIFPNPVRGDSTITLTTVISKEKDAKGNISKITVDSNSSNGDKKSHSFAWYTWNRKARWFDEGVR